jgi:iron-sulfur cluster repair protein YtfE (RIC family)
MKHAARSFELSSYEKQEMSCPVCDCSGNSEALKPVPVLTKLQKEHEAILRQNRVLLMSLEATIRTGHRKRAIAGNLTARYLARLKKLIDEYQMHEERFLIPIVDEYLDSNISESIRNEHKNISDALGLLNGKLNGIDRPNQRASHGALFKCAAKFDSVTREHFSREENVIFWFARICLSQSIPRGTGSAQLT